MKTKSPTVCVPACTSQRRKAHDDNRAETEDDALAEVQPAERGPYPGGGGLVARHRTVEALGFHPLVVEIFDRLEIEQRVDRLGAGVGVAVVHVAANDDAPVARPDGEPDVEPDRHRHHSHVVPAISDREDAGCQREFEDGRQGVEHGEADDRLDALGAALDDARQAAGAALEMEAQRQLMHVDEGAEGELAHRILSDAGKQRVAQLVEAELHQPHDIVGDDQHDWRQQEGRQRRRRLGVTSQRIGRPFEEVGTGNQCQLGDDQKHGRPHHPRPQVGTVGRPHIGPKIAQCLEGRARIGGDGFFGHFIAFSYFLLLDHDLFRKPASTFRRRGPSVRDDGLAAGAARIDQRGQRCGNIFERIAVDFIAGALPIRLVADEPGIDQYL